MWIGLMYVVAQVTLKQISLCHLSLRGVCLLWLIESLGMYGLKNYPTENTRLWRVLSKESLATVLFKPSPLTMILLFQVGNNWKKHSTLKYISVTHIILGRRVWWRTPTGGLECLFQSKEISKQFLRENCKRYKPFSILFQGKSLDLDRLMRYN